MKRPEFLARLLIVLGTIVILIPFVAHYWNRTVEVHARVAESGGWNPGVIQAEVDRPLRVRLTSDDVMHGFAVGQIDMAAVDVLPGKVTDLTLIFDQPGTYTFYCTRWCGLDHWRMRGRIEVGDAANAPKVDATPLYVALGLDIDAPHPAPILPARKPSAARGREFAGGFSLYKYFNSKYYRSHSPAQAYLDLRAENALQSLTDRQVWDVVAYLWESQTTHKSLQEGQKLYVQNCAACHGETGAGDGVFADDLVVAGEASAMALDGMSGMSMQKPVDFTDAEQMLGASPALLQGKLLRGGMGTGMPMWGVIFTDRQTWEIVAYLYAFQFQEDSK